MTTIVAVQKDDGVYFGADSLVTSTRKYNHPNMVKISERNNYIIAGAGLSSFCDVAQHIWEPPTPTVKDKKDLYHFVISKVIPSMKESFKANDLKLESEKEEDTRFAFLIAVCGEVFDIAEDFAVSMSSSGFYGVGSGSSLAIGALEAGATIKSALQIASKHDPYTSAPFLFLQQLKSQSSSKSSGSIAIASPITG
jgi:ATP-dependent protease HslVU (ClpYQ) peptidase subunit